MVVGLVLGLPAAAAVAKALLDKFSGDLFPMPFVVSAPTVIVTVLGVVVVVWLSQGPALRRIGRASLADAVRVRS